MIHSLPVAPEFTIRLSVFTNPSARLQEYLNPNVAIGLYFVAFALFIFAGAGRYLQ